MTLFAGTVRGAFRHEDEYYLWIRQHDGLVWRWRRIWPPKEDWRGTFHEDDAEPCICVDPVTAPCDECQADHEEVS